MAEADKLNVDSVIARLLEGLLGFLSPPLAVFTRHST